MLSPATHGQITHLHLVEVRSTKAGMLSPATRRSRWGRCGFPPPLNEGRDVKPGDTGDAAAEAPVGAVRSTKAGMLSPATPAALAPRSPRTCALNEGRDVKPGDTVPFLWKKSAFLPAQRRPGC